MHKHLKLILKGCSHCHGDLVLDEGYPNHGATIAYECLQCGRTTRLMEPAAEREKAAAA